MALTLADLSPEIRLLLACCHAELDVAQQAALVEAAAAVTDWARVPPLAREYMVSPLVHQHLKTYAADRVPTAVMAQLERQRQRAVRHNLLLVAELKRLVRDWLEPLAIPYVAFKGPVLAQALYGDIGLRQSRDLDVLVEASRLHELVQRLLAAGYRPLYADHAATPQRLAAICHFLPVVCLRSPEGIVIELHKELGSVLGGFPIAPEWQFANAQEQELAGQLIRVMSSIEGVLYLCHHHGKHQWSRMHWLADLNVLMAAQVSDLELIGQRATELGLAAQWQDSLRLHAVLQGAATTSWGDHDLPVVVLRMLNGESLKPEAVSRQLFLSRRGRWLNRMTTVAQAWRVRPDWPSRLRYLVRILRPTESDLTWVDLPRPLYGFYWLIKPLRWLWEMRRRELPAAHDHA